LQQNYSQKNIQNRKILRRRKSSLQFQYNQRTKNESTQSEKGWGREESRETKKQKGILTKHRTRNTGVNIKIKMKIKINNARNLIMNFSKKE
jgi:hypothetical protein